MKLNKSTNKKNYASFQQKKSSKFALQTNKPFTCKAFSIYNGYLLLLTYSIILKILYYVRITQVNKGTSCLFVCVYPKLSPL